MRCDISGTIVYRGTRRPEDVTPKEWKTIINLARTSKRTLDEVTEEWRTNRQHPPAAATEFVRSGLPPVGSDGTILVHVTRRHNTESITSLLRKAQDWAPIIARMTTSGYDITPFGHEGLKCYAPWDAQRIDEIKTLGISDMGHYILMYEDELPTLQNIFSRINSKRRPATKIFRPNEEGIRVHQIITAPEPDETLSGATDQRNAIRKHIRTAYHMFDGQGDADRTLTQKIYDELNDNHHEDMR